MLRTLQLIYPFANCRWFSPPLSFQLKEETCQCDSASALQKKRDFAESQHHFLMRVTSLLPADPPLRTVLLDILLDYTKNESDTK